MYLRYTIYLYRYAYIYILPGGFRTGLFRINGHTSRNDPKMGRCTGNNRGRSAIYSSDYEKISNSVTYSSQIRNGMENYFHMYQQMGMNQNCLNIHNVAKIKLGQPLYSVAANGKLHQPAKQLIGLREKLQENPMIFMGTSEWFPVKIFPFLSTH